MPNIKSSMRSVKTDSERNLKNSSAKSAVRTAAKKVVETAKAKDAAVAQENLVKATSLLDKAAGKGILHKNTVARKKSRLAKRVNSIAK